MPARWHDGKKARIWNRELSMDAFQDQLVDLIVEESGLVPDLLQASTGLMSTGIPDSFALVAVISFMEDRIDGEVPPVDLTFDNFDTVGAICACVERALAA